MMPIMHINKLIRISIYIVSMLMILPLSSCGDSSSNNSQIEITTPSNDLALSSYEQSLELSGNFSSNLVTTKTERVCYCTVPGIGGLFVCLIPISGIWECRNETHVYGPSIELSNETIQVSNTGSSDKSNYTWNGTVSLVHGENNIKVTATNGGKRASDTITVTVPQMNPLLSDLTISNGVLNEAFEPTLFEYSAVLCSQYASTLLRPVSSGNYVTWSVADNPYHSYYPVNLDYGDNEIIIKAIGMELGEVVASNDYSLSIYLETPTFFSLDLSAGQVEQLLDQDTFLYTASIAYDDNTLSITPYLTNSCGNVSINGAPVESHQFSSPIQLGEGGNLISIDLYEGDQVNTYEILMNRDSTAEFLQSSYVKASNTSIDDNFGGGLYSQGGAISLSGEILAVGVPLEDSNATGVNGNDQDDSNYNSGAVYVFSHNDVGEWSQEAYIKPLSIMSISYFGSSVAISGDTLVIGSPYEYSDNGSAYVYTRDVQGIWSLQDRITAPVTDTDTPDSFGAQVSISGNTLAIGAHREDSSAIGIDGDEYNNNSAASGAVYIYTRNNSGVWSKEAYIKASNTESRDYFGTSISLQAGILAVGAHGEDSAATGINGDQSNNDQSSSGVVYVFSSDDFGNWSQEAYIKPSTQHYTFFGNTVRLSGNTLAVGTQVRGEAYVFTRDGGGVWTEQAHITAHTPQHVCYGAAKDNVALSGDTLVIGSSCEDSKATGINGDESDDSYYNAGAALIYKRNGSNLWMRQAYVKASNTNPGDEFGSVLAIDGAIIAIGAPLESSNATGINGSQSDNSSDASGAVYIFE
jgi:hypothetical protein